MDTSKIYERIILTTYYKRIQAIRNHNLPDDWNPNDTKYGVDTVIDITCQDYYQYKGYIDQCHELFYKMIGDIVTQLSEAYDKDVHRYYLRRNSEYFFQYSDGEVIPGTVRQSNEKVLSLFTHGEIVYILMEYGIDNSLPDTVIDILLSDGITKYRYVSIVDSNAYSEAINHNDDETDPTRGTNKLSLHDFFNLLFGEQEYLLFKKYCSVFEQKVKDHLGFSIIKTLQPGTKSSFRRVIRENLLRFPSHYISTNSRISEKQFKALVSNFTTNHNYELLLGNSDFAQSFMTAEWLYSSILNAGTFDLTTIALGYFKAIEQLLYKFISLHIYEKDSRTVRKLSIRNHPLADSKGLVELNATLLNDTQAVNLLTLSSLTSFFGYYDKKMSRYVDLNKDLLDANIDTSTYHSIIDTFAKLTPIRNDFVHKNNMNDPKELQIIRDNAYSVAFLLLGAYVLSEKEKLELGRVIIDKPDEFQNLCHYLYLALKNKGDLCYPIIYTSKDAAKDDFWIFSVDPSSFNHLGEPIFEDIIVYRCGDSNNRKHISREHKPDEIWEGTFRISNSIPIHYDISGPQKQLFTCNTFTENH